MPKSEEESPKDKYRLDLNLYPGRDSLDGPSRAEDEKQVLARLAFLEVVTKDQRVVDLWRTWGRYTGLNDSADALGSAIDQLATSAGLEHRGSIRKIYDTGSAAEIAALEESFNPELVDIAEEALAEFGLCLDRVYGFRKQMSDEAISFVRDTLQLSWPWLTLELIECFEYSAVALACGSIISLEAMAEEKEPQERREVINLMRSYRDKVVIRGRVPVDEEAEFQDGVGKNARWFYRNRLCGESIGHIAASDGSDSATIGSGIVKAERLLGLTEEVNEQPNDEQLITRPKVD